MGQQDELRRRAALEAQHMWKIDQIFSFGSANENADQFDPSPKAEMISASAITPMRTEWLWPGRIPMGMLTLFSGDPKLGKSLVTLGAIAAVTRGGPLPVGGAAGSAMAPKGSAIILSVEERFLGRGKVPVKERFLEPLKSRKGS